jgi:hypothetical protein
MHKAANIDHTSSSSVTLHQEQIDLPVGYKNYRKFSSLNGNYDFGIEITNYLMLNT